MSVQNKRLIGIVLSVPLLLLVPLVAMQFTDEVTWTPADFVLMGVLLFSTGLLGELVLRNISKIEYRIVLCVVLLAGLFLFWLELAVGIFGTPFAGQ